MRCLLKIILLESIACIKFYFLKYESTATMFPLRVSHVYFWFTVDIVFGATLELDQNLPYLVSFKVDKKVIDQTITAYSTETLKKRFFSSSEQRVRHTWLMKMEPAEILYRVL